MTILGIPFMPFGIAVAVLLADLVWLLLTFDELIKTEYLYHRPQWEADGEPYGNFWSPPEPAYGGPHSGEYTHHSSFYGWWHSMFWMFSTPDWIRGDKAASGLLRRFRVAGAIWNVGSVAVVVAVILASLASR